MQHLHSRNEFQVATKNLPHIAVVDDDEDIRETFSEYLSDHGYRATCFGSAAELRSSLASGIGVDLVLLDIAMPGEDGLSLARFLSERTDAIIIMVTASGETVDRIIGLEIGADDYLPKPVDLRELLARIKAALRRGGGAAPVAPRPSERPDLVQFGRCRLDLDAQRLFDEDGREIALTAMEFDLLKVFSERPNRILTREMLLDLAHHGNCEPFDRSIDLRIARLRRKIERDPGKPEVIRTKRGAGYLFAPRSEDAR
jgi:two-component system phosphate regulon response regulator OmpR